MPCGLGRASGELPAPRDVSGLDTTDGQIQLDLVIVTSAFHNCRHMQLILKPSLPRAAGGLPSLSEQPQAGHAVR